MITSWLLHVTLTAYKITKTKHFPLCPFVLKKYSLKNFQEEKTKPIIICNYHNSNIFIEIDFQKKEKIPKYYLIK